MNESLKQKFTCEHCKDTGLDPKSYDEHIFSNIFWFAKPCLHCEKGKKWKALMNEKERMLTVEEAETE